MLKKIFSTIAVISLSTGLALANGGTFTPPAASHTGGFYIGAAASHNSAFSETTDNVYEQSAVVKNQTTTKHDLANQNWGGELFAGYGMLFNHHYYLGAEIFGGKSQLKATNKAILNIVAYDNQVIFDTRSFNVSTSIKIKDSYGASLIPGIFLNKNTLLYGRIGWTRSQFKLRDSDISNELPLDSPSTYSLHTYKKKSANGFQIGLGLETMLSHCFSIRGEYDWSRYPNINVRSNTSIDGSSTFYRTVQADHPEVAQFTLAGILRFGNTNAYTPLAKDSLATSPHGNFYLGAAASRDFAQYNAKAIYQPRAFNHNAPDISANGLGIATREQGKHSWNGKLFGGYA